MIVVQHEVCNIDGIGLDWDLWRGRRELSS
jgi:hypothetical protein